MRRGTKSLLRAAERHIKSQYKCSARTWFRRYPEAFNRVGVLIRYPDGRYWYQRSVCVLDTLPCLPIIVANSSVLVAISGPVYWHSNAAWYRCTFEGDFPWGEYDLS